LQVAVLAPAHRTPGQSAPAQSVRKGSCEDWDPAHLVFAAILGDCGTKDADEVGAIASAWQVAPLRARRSPGFGGPSAVIASNLYWNRREPGECCPAAEFSREGLDVLEKGRGTCGAARVVVPYVQHLTRPSAAA